VITSDWAGPSATAGEAVLLEIVLELELRTLGPAVIVVEDADTDEREVGGADPLSLDEALSLLRLFPSRLLVQSVNIDNDKRVEASIPTILAIDFSFWTDFLTDFSGDKAVPLGRLWVPLTVVPPVTMLVFELILPSPTPAFRLPTLLLLVRALEEVSGCAPRLVES